MILSVAASGLVALVVVCARWRGRRLRAATARETALRAERHAQHRAQLDAVSERLYVAEQDRDASRLIAARHLLRAWRAERALAAVRGRDEAAAYAEHAERGSGKLRAVAS